MATDKKKLDLNDLLTLDQLSQLLQVRKSWVYRQVREQAIPHVHVGKYLRFSRAEVEKWLAQHQAN